MFNTVRTRLHYNSLFKAQFLGSAFGDLWARQYLHHLIWLLWGMHMCQISDLVYMYLQYNGKFFKFCTNKKPLHFIFNWNWIPVSNLLVSWTGMMLENRMTKVTCWLIVNYIPHLSNKLSLIWLLKPKLLTMLHLSFIFN